MFFRALCDRKATESKFRPQKPLTHACNKWLACQACQIRGYGGKYALQLSVAFSQPLFALQPSHPTMQVSIADAAASWHFVQGGVCVPPLHLVMQLSLFALAWVAQLLIVVTQACGTAQGITGVEFVVDGRSS